VVAAAQLRAGNTSARGAAWQVAERSAPPVGAAPPGSSWCAPIGVYTKAVIAVCRRDAARFSVTARMDAKVSAACQANPATHWVDIKYAVPCQNWTLVQALVWTVSVEVSLVGVQHGAGMLFVVKQHMVGALPAYAANEPFGIAVRPRRTGRDLHDLNAFGGQHRVEGTSELAVPIADQEPKRRCPISLWGSTIPSPSLTWPHVVPSVCLGHDRVSCRCA
jgi:hypothetical protein